MPTKEPRWFALAALPVLATALWLVDFRVKDLLWTFAERSYYLEFMWLGYLAAAFAGSTITALVVAYPLGRIYGQRAAAVGLVVVLPAVANGVWEAPTGDSFFIRIWPMHLLCVGVLVPGLAWLAARSLARSRLGLAPLDTSFEPPRLLAVAFLPLLLFATHLWNQWGVDVAAQLSMHHKDRDLRYAMMVTCAIGAGLVSALAAAYPVARLYGRCAWLAALVVVAWAVWEYATRPWRMPMVGIFYRADAITLAVLAPVFASLVWRRVRESRLVIVPSPA